MNITYGTFRWYDPDTTDTVKIACQEYGVTFIESESKGPDEIEVVVKGPEDNVNQLLEDIEEDSVEPFESKRDLSDNEYQFWLKEALAKFGITYAMKLEDDEDCPFDDNDDVEIDHQEVK